MHINRVKYVSRHFVYVNRMDSCYALVMAEHINE